MGKNMTFSLTCVICDAGMDVPSHRQAIQLGWVELYHEPEGFSWTCTGVCPACVAEGYDVDTDDQMPLFGKETT